jgi:predicted S18 family serine protease
MTMEKENKNTIDMINGLAEIADYMQDEELTQALTFISKVILRKDVPMQVATLEVVRLQAIAAKMAFRATWLTNVDKGDRAKKNIYYTAAEAINDLVAALKYVIR